MDVNEYARDFEAGIQPDRTPYGFHHAEENGFEVVFAEHDRSPWRRRLAQLCISKFQLDIPHAIYNRSRIADADVIWTMSEWSAMEVRLVMWLGLVPRRPIIGPAIWVFDWWDTLRFHRRLLYRFLLNRMDVIVTHSIACLEKARICLPDAKIELMHFGIAAENFLPDDHKDDEKKLIRIVSAGNDMTRDWNVLLEAFGNQEGFELIIINRELSDDFKHQYRNLSIIRLPSMDEFRRLYMSATYVAVPLRENIYSGITVALEAMALSLPIMATNSGGIPTYLNDEEALLVPPGDALAWLTAASSQTSNERQDMAQRAHARFRREAYTTQGMMRRYADATEVVLGARP